MKSLFDLRKWAAEAPPGSTINVESLLDMMDDFEMDAAPELVRAAAAPPPPWRLLLWTADPETRIGRAELLEAVGRSTSWLYRHTGAGKKEPIRPEDRIPHRKLEGELVFVVGEARQWLREREEIVTAGPMDRPRPLRAS